MKRECRACGLEFLATHFNQRLCSDRCRSKRAIQAVSDWAARNPEKRAAYQRKSRLAPHRVNLNRNAAHLRRALRAGAPIVGDFDFGAVMERDGGVCQICMEPIVMDAPVNSPPSPTVDHITPLSMGGVHGMSNVRAAHKGCNTRTFWEMRREGA